MGNPEDGTTISVIDEHGNTLGYVNINLIGIGDVFLDKGHCFEVETISVYCVTVRKISGTQAINKYISDRCDGDRLLRELVGWDMVKLNKGRAEK